MQYPRSQHNLTQAGTDNPFKYRLARLGVFCWRFRTLPWASRLFSTAPAGCILQRNFYGYRLFVDVSRTNTQRLLYLEGKRVVCERNLVRSLLLPGMTVVDVGANIGYFLLLFKSVIGPEGTVFCVEPEPTNRTELQRNIRANALQNVHVLPVAAGKHDGLTSFNTGLNGTVAATGDGDITVPMRRLDSLFPSSSVHLVKIDVDGYELEVLEGADALISRCKPTLVVEVHPDLLQSTEAVDRIFRSLDTHYDKVTAYFSAPQNHLRDKLLTRYLGLATVRKWAGKVSVVEACRNRQQRDPFWVVARSSRVEAHN